MNGIAVLSLTIAATAFGQQDAKPQSDQHGSMQMKHDMQMGSQQMQGMQMTGDPDRDFVTMMRQHHQQAVEMAKTELKDGKDATAKAFARKLIQEQHKEIKQFEQWLSKHGAGQ